jgi:hypothetical protein
VSTAMADCVKPGQKKAFETMSFSNARGPYDLEKIVAYPTSVKGAGPQYTPSC